MADARVASRRRSLARGAAFVFALGLVTALTAAAAIASGAFAPRVALAQEGEPQPVAPPIDGDKANPVQPRPRLLGGAWEVNFGGTFSNTNGVSYGSVDMRAGTFRPAGDGLVGLETLL